jgi:surfactin synthase thioesterase subunit
VRVSAPSQPEPAWFIRSAADGGPTRLRLLCFPPAGGAASMFRGWERALPADVEVLAAQLPGRAERWAEPPVTELARLVDVLAEQAAPLVGEPFAFLGHSLGGLVAVELARRLRQDHGRDPVRLFVANCAAPVPARRLPTLSALDDDELPAALAALGLADDVLADEELMELLRPVLRADFRLGDSYRSHDGATLSCPVSAFHGTRDPMVALDDVAAWRELTAGPVRVRSIDAGHLLTGPQWAAVLALVSEDLAADLAAGIVD